MINYGIQKDVCVVDARYFNRHQPTLSWGDWIWIWAKCRENAVFCGNCEPIEDEV